MLSLPPSVRVFVALAPADMRCGFDGLSARVREVPGADPLSGHLYVFWNRRRDRVKVLYWDRSGYCLWYKRLERGRFRFAVSEEGGQVEIEHADLALILEGIDLSDAVRRRRWVPRKTA